MAKKGRGEQIGASKTTIGMAEGVETKETGMAKDNRREKNISSRTFRKTEKRTGQLGIVLTE